MSKDSAGITSTARLSDISRSGVEFADQTPKRLTRTKPESLSVPMSINDVWSMNLIHDQLCDVHSIRLFNVIDDFNREDLGIDFDFSMPAARVIRSASLHGAIAGGRRL